MVKTHGGRYVKTTGNSKIGTRNWTLDDVEDLYAYAKYDQVGPSAGWPAYKSVEDSMTILQSFIKSRDVYALEYKDTGQVIGSLGVHAKASDTQEKVIEIGYVLHPEYWGLGLVAEAGKRVIEDQITNHQVDVIWCCHFDFNHQSKRVIEKLGFTYHSSDKRTLDLLDGREVESLRYQIKSGLNL